MVESPITINFANRQSTTSDCLKLEQEPWGEDVGETTKMQGIMGIAAAINGSRWPEVRCGGLNGIFTATVYSYPNRSDLVYQFKVSHGQVAQSRAEFAYREEVIQCSLQDKITPDYPVQSTGLLAWIGSCYDNRGNVTSRPDVEVIDGIIHLSKEVYGSLRFRYKVFRREHKIEISKRQQAFENKYESVAYAVWDGGVVWLDVEPPSGFEAFDGDCGNGAFYEDGDGLQDGYGDGQLGQTDICKPEYSSNKLPVAVAADRKIKVDYCSQEVTSDKTTESVDYDNDTDKSECDD